MDKYIGYGLLLALVNGAVCISIPALVSYTKRKKQPQDIPCEDTTVINTGELLSQEAN